VCDFSRYWQSLSCQRAVPAPVESSQIFGFMVAFSPHTEGDEHSPGVSKIFSLLAAETLYHRCQLPTWLSGDLLLTPMGLLPEKTSDLELGE